MESAFGAGRIRVAVRVTTADGATAHDAYVALIPEWRPWSRPVVEAVAANGTVFAAVSPGKYYISACASGHACKVDGPFLIDAKSNDRFSLELLRLRRVEGVVLDEAGNPLVGVRVRDARAAIPPPLDVVSEMALRRFDGEWGAKTAQDGSWTLEVPDGAVPLIFDAPGRAVALHFSRPNDPLPLTITLKRGASLALKLDRADPSMIVTLVRGTSAGDSRIPPDWEARLLAQYATAQELRWDSIPAGQYRVIAKIPDPRYFSDARVPLGEVMLSARESREMTVAMPPKKNVAQHIARIYLPKVSADEVQDLNAFGTNRSEATPRELDHVLETVIGGTTIHLRIDDVRPPFFAVTAEEFIAVPAPGTERDVEAGQPWDEEVPLAVTHHPRANVFLVIRSSDTQIALPGHGVAVFRDCAKRERISIPLKVNAAGEVRFVAPAACSNATLDFDPFEPVVIERALRRGDQALGTFILRPAATFDAHVVQGELSVANAHVVVSATAQESQDRRAIVISESVTGADGWTRGLRLPVLRPLQVTASAAGKGESDNIEMRLEPHAHRVVDPVELKPAATLIVEPRIAESIRAQFPSARVRAIFLEPVDARISSSDERRQFARDDSSPLEFGDLHPGQWRIRGIVMIAGTSSPLDGGIVELAQGERRRVTPTFEPFVFSGRIAQSGRGVAARMTLRDTGGATGPLPSVDSASDGSFHLLLPHKGRYAVDAARLSAQGNIIPLGEVEFVDPGRPIELTMPPVSQVLVHVLLDGAPVPRAVVTATLRHTEDGVLQPSVRSRTTNSAGNSLFEDMPPGTWSFTAEAPGHRAANSDAAVIDDRDTEVSLELHDTAMVGGRVRDAAGTPLQSVLIDCLFTGSSAGPRERTATSDGEGVFDLDLNEPGPLTASCSAVSPGGAVDSFQVQSGSRVEVSLGGATAALRIDDWGERLLPNAYWLVGPSGRLISLSAAASKLWGYGASLTLPALRAGRWKIVRVTSLADWQNLAAGRGEWLPMITEVAVEPGHETAVRIHRDSGPH